MFKKFREAGLCVVPLNKGVPLVEWSRYFNELPDTEAVENFPTSNEYGLVCGKVSGIIALDIDTDDAEGLRAYQLAGKTPVRKKGSKGFTAFYRWSEGFRSTSWKKPDGKAPIVELLCDKRITTIPPSPHRKTGKPYEWLEGELIGSELPEISGDFLTLMDALYPKPRRVAEVVSYDRSELEDIQLSDAEDMLDYISSDCDRDEWISIGMALRDEFGDAACELWHRWSAKAGSRYNHNAAQSAWRSFTHDGYTIGTIVHKAKQSGWIRESQIPDVSFAVDINYIKALKGEDKPLEVHGLVGEIANWITETAIRPQPILSLAAAIAFVGMLKGHKIEGSTALRTNTLVMALAPTGSGKEHPQRKIRDLMRLTDMDKHLMGEPTSGTGFLRAINDRGRVTLWVMDEMGRFLENVSGRNAGTFQREIVDYIIKTFSCANSILKGREYADSKKNPTIDIQEPHFCCLGSTVTERFKSSCKSEEVIDGFLNRWIVLSAKDRGKVAGTRKNMLQPPSQGILDAIQAIGLPEYDPYTGDAMLKEVKFSPEAWDIYDDYRSMMDERIDSASYPLNALYARCAEHVEKLALILCDNDMIGVRDVNAAIRVVNFSNSCIMEFAGLIADNESEAESIKVREIIKAEGTISKSDLTGRTRFLKRMRRTEILNDLVDSGDVFVEKVGNSTYFTSKIQV